MITFGYKGRFTGVLRAVTAIAVGAVMVWSKANALNIAVQIIAAFLIASGVVSMIVGYRNKENGLLGLMGVNTVVDILIGLLLLFFPGFFAGLLVYLIAFVLVMLGFMQLLSLGSANQVLRMGVFAFIMPVIVLLLGLFLFLRPSFVGETIGILAGVALIFYGVTELFSSWKMRKAIEEYDIKYPSQQPEDTDVKGPVEAKDVDYEKVDEQ